MVRPFIVCMANRASLPSLLTHSALLPVLNGKHYQAHCMLCHHKYAEDSNSPVPFCSSLTHRRGKMNSFGWLRYSGFSRHKDPMLDAAGALADLLVFSLNLTGLTILQKIENQDNSW